MLDLSVPALTEIRPTNRQQSRRVERDAYRCRWCRGNLTATDVCFSDGKDAHLSCSERRNREIEGAVRMMAEQAHITAEAADNSSPALAPRPEPGTGTLTAADVKPLIEKEID